MLCAQIAGSEPATSAIGSITPALFTRISTGPSRCLVAATVRSTAPWSETSQASASVRKPAPAISRATRAAKSPSRATSMTAAPAAASARAAPSPSPRLAPVTTATFPFNSSDTAFPPPFFRWREE
jgi:hypothetical protein